MAWREKLFVAGAKGGSAALAKVESLMHKDAQKDLSRILAQKNSYLWGETPVVARSRKYKQGGEVRNEYVHAGLYIALAVQSSLRIQLSPCTALALLRIAGALQS